VIVLIFIPKGKNGNKRIVDASYVRMREESGWGWGGLFARMLRVGRLTPISLWLSTSLLVPATALPADFTIASPGFFYTVNWQGSNPTITLIRGRTYTFAIQASSFHPFLINSKGVQNNDISSGTITFAVPDVASNYTYICSIHNFGGNILTVPPPAPPPAPKIRILSLSMGTNLILRSTGTNTWSVQPEYSTNLAGTNWFALTVLTNRFSLGTNETICGVPPEASALIRIRSQPN